MKLVINGYTVSERLEITLDKKYWDLAQKIIDHIKRNSGLYFYTVYIASLLLNIDFMIYPNDIAGSFHRVSVQLIDLILYVAKWEFLFRGIEGVVSLLFKRCSLYKGGLKCIRNLTGFLLIEYYPKLVDMFKTIRI